VVDQFRLGTDPCDERQIGTKVMAG
jgi:hypothetical protein